MKWLESITVGALGALLGAGIGWPLGWETALGIVAGVNGLVAGFHAIYNWRTVTGCAAFLFDSTWGLLGTAGGLAVMFGQFVVAKPHFRPDLSRRRGRFVFEKGFHWKPGFASTVGHVVSNGGSGRRRELLIDRHEMAHVWQGRIGGPLFLASYLAWLIIGVVVGTVTWPWVRSGWKEIVETFAYYNNPFEYWAYRRDEHWPPRGASKKFAWRKTGRR